MPASLERPETSAASIIVYRGRSIHELLANATGANHQDWLFDMENQTLENQLRNPRGANMTSRYDRSTRYVKNTGNNGQVQAGFEKEEDDDDENDEQDEPGVVGEFGEVEPEGEDDDD